MKEILFYIVIFLANTIQGVTGFAGTILAMPFSLRLVGYEVAVPVLNLLGVLAGVYVFVFNYKSVQWKEVAKVVLVMACAMLVGTYAKPRMADYDKLTYIFLGILVLVIAIKGLYKLFCKKDEEDKALHPVVGAFLVILAGFVHSIFVCGGPLLIGYLAQKVKDKTKFRATISTIWIFLNGMLLCIHAKQGMWTAPVIKSGLISIPVLFGGMAFGSFLYKRMNQRGFLILTYVLLVIAAVSLFMK